LFAACVLFFVLAASAFCQEATITGTVTDPSGAVVPGVKVIATNTDKNQTTDASTNDAGQFTFPSLVIGHYSVKAEVSGFKSFEKNDINLEVGDRARVDVQLQVGNTKDSVTVEAAAIAVQSESGEVSDVITGKEMTQLATNGRSIYALTTLTPGASSNMSDFSSPTSIGGDSSVSFNGLRQNHNLYIIDGGEADDRGGAGGMDIMPSLDAVAEFRVMTSNYSADYGLSSGGTMTLAVKSGTKDLHAEAWEFNRNNALDATPFFTNRTPGAVVPELRFNTYGFNVGGPVTLGKLYNKNRDKTFFFYNQEWRKQITGQQLNQTVPSTANLAGQFSSPINIPSSNQVTSAIASQFASDGLLLSAPNCGTSGNPACNIFPGNRIPTNLINPNSAALVAAGIFPAPNNGTQFIGGANQPVNLREEIIRIDHRFNDKFSIFGHYMKDDVVQNYGTSLWSGSNVPSVGTTLTNPAYHYVIHATYSITPTVLNEVAYNQNGNVINIVPNGIYKRPSDLNIPELFSGNNDNRIPGISINGSANYDVSSWPWHNKADDYQIRDDLSIVKGSHQIKMGASWALYKKEQDLFGDTQGAFSFNGLFTGNSTADFLLGYANSYTELAVQDHGQWNNQSPAAYFQDNWHVNSHLTLNLGLRWDGIPHTYEANNRGSNFYYNLYNPADTAVFVAGSGGSVISPNSPGLGTSPNPILAGTQFYLNGIGIPGQGGVPTTLVKSDWATFGPRIGFAYDLGGDHKSVIRGGFGTMYERIQGNDMYNGGPNQPFSASVTNNNVNINNPAAALATGINYVSPISVGSIQGLSYNNYKPPTSYQYSIGFERELANNTLLNVSYVGNQERHQSSNAEINLPAENQLQNLSTLGGPIPYNTAVQYPGYHQIDLYQDNLNGHYNGLQVSLKSQVRRDLTLQVAYTYSKAFDQGTGGDLAAVSNPYNYAYDNGPSPYDRRSMAIISFIYDLPIFRNTQNKLLHGTLGGWQASGIITMETGLPIYINLSGSQSSNGLPDATNRPNFSGAVDYISNATSLQYFNTSGFSTPQLGAWGNLTKGLFYGPGRENFNISMFKRFTFSERATFELRVETYNTFNHTEFNGVGNSYGSSTFGQYTSTWDPRVFQLGGKLIF
jgi:hypothetical protein